MAEIRTSRQELRRGPSAAHRGGGLVAAVVVLVLAMPGTVLAGSITYKADTNWSNWTWYSDRTRTSVDGGSIKIPGDMFTSCRTESRYQTGGYKSHAQGGCAWGYVENGHTPGITGYSRCRSQSDVGAGQYTMICRTTV